MRRIAIIAGRPCLIFALSSLARQKVTRALIDHTRGMGTAK